MNTVTAAPAHVEEMAVIHRVFRRGFPMVAGLVRRTPRGATGRSQPIAAHLDFLLNGLHHHHTGEDENIWPLVLDRAAEPADLISRMEAQHAVVADRADQVPTLLGCWRDSAVNGESLAEALDQFTPSRTWHRQRKPPGSPADCPCPSR